MLDKEKEYLKATIHTTTQGAEALFAVLPALGIEGFSVEDPADFEYIAASKDRLAWDFIGAPPASDMESGEARVVFWLEKEAAADARSTSSALIRAVREALMRLKSDEQYGLYGDGADFGRLWLDTETVRDDWKEKYKESFHTFSPCEGIVVMPPWEVDGAAYGSAGMGLVADRAEGAEGAYTGFGAAADSGGAGIRLVIDPGMAFGTGLHETTAMCLARLKEVLRPGDTMLDAGTGSGILAIAAALLGAGHVDAVEFDEDAAASAARNIAANGAGGIISLITGDITAPGILPSGAKYDLITANLSCPLLEKLAPVFAEALADGGKAPVFAEALEDGGAPVFTDGGKVILSGLLDAQGERVLEALENAGLRAGETLNGGEWLMIEARK